MKRIKWLISAECHMGIHGNYEAGMAANSVIQFKETTFKIPSTDLKFFIRYPIHEKTKYISHSKRQIMKIF